MITHKNGSITYSKEEAEAMVILSVAFTLILPKLAEIVETLDKYEAELSKFDSVRLFGLPSLNERTS